METNEQRNSMSAAHIAPGKGGKSLWVFGDLVTCKITGYRTGGAYSLFEVVTWPGSSPPRHVQHREDEAFYVLEGEYEFLVEGRTINAVIGSLIYVPKGNLHTHKNVGEEPARMLVSQTPGGLHERFFEEIGEEAKDTPTLAGSENLPDLEGIARIAAEYGIEMPTGSLAQPAGSGRSMNENEFPPTSGDGSYGMGKKRRH